MSVNIKGEYEQIIDALEKMVQILLSFLTKELHQL